MGRTSRIRPVASQVKSGCGDDAHGLAFRGDEERESVEGRQRAERRDDRVDVQHRDDEAVDRPAEQARRDPGQDRERHRPGPERADHALRDHDRREHRRDARDRANRDIEGAADDHHGFADGQQPHDHDALGEAVHQVLPRPEEVAALHADERRDDTDEDDQDHQRADQRQVVDADRGDDPAQAPPAPTGGCRDRGVGGAHSCPSASIAASACSAVIVR